MTLRIFVTFIKDSPRTKEVRKLHRVGSGKHKSPLTGSGGGTSSNTTSVNSTSGSGKLNIRHSSQSYGYSLSNEKPYEKYACEKDRSSDSGESGDEEELGTTTSPTRSHIFTNAPLPPAKLKKKARASAATSASGSGSGAGLGAGLSLPLPDLSDSASNSHSPSPSPSRSPPCLPLEHLPSLPSSKERDYSNDDICNNTSNNKAKGMKHSHSHSHSLSLSLSLSQSYESSPTPSTVASTVASPCCQSQVCPSFHPLIF